MVESLGTLEAWFRETFRGYTPCSPDELQSLRERWAARHYIPAALRGIGGITGVFGAYLQEAAAAGGVEVGRQAVVSAGAPAVAALLAVVAAADAGANWWQRQEEAEIEQARIDLDCDNRAHKFYGLAGTVGLSFLSLMSESGLRSIPSIVNVGRSAYNNFRVLLQINIERYMTGDDMGFLVPVSGPGGGGGRKRNKTKRR